MLVTFSPYVCKAWKYQRFGKFVQKVNELALSGGWGLSGKILPQETVSC